jgi:hypothetical protein
MAGVESPGQQQWQGRTARDVTYNPAEVLWVAPWTPGWRLLVAGDTGVSCWVVVGHCIAHQGM